MINFENLKRAQAEMSFLYILIYAEAKKTLSDYFKAREKEPAFPIDYIDLANWLGIEVKLEDLNHYTYRNSRYGRLVENKEHKYSILVQHDAPLLTRIYATCFEISVYLLDDKRNCLCRDNLFSEVYEEILLDIFTSFLILPPELTSKEIDKYVKANYSRDIDKNELYTHLSERNHIPYLKVVTSFEHLRILTSCFYSESNLNKIIENFDEETVKVIKEIYENRFIIPEEYFIRPFS